ncbi:hypothetical protein FM106_23170 [Brachybacterium faecium]|nr:hypothetical protein FM106_23170 [Brachybacterium faecium]
MGAPAAPGTACVGHGPRGARSSSGTSRAGRGPRPARPVAARHPRRRRRIASTGAVPAHAPLYGDICWESASGCKGWARPRLTAPRPRHRAYADHTALTTPPRPRPPGHTSRPAPSGPHRPGGATLTSPPDRAAAATLEPLPVSRRTI